ncbi:recombinase family protein [Nocardia sp. NPDC005998]|uniref:recombinase family protein n=1 Tax=Nocardia sp. NPDC005998 TaxID=3156894 RepID=UPI0033B39719
MASVSKRNRLGRSLEHLIELSNTLQDRGVVLVVLDQGSDPPLPSAACSSKPSARLPNSSTPESARPAPVTRPVSRGSSRSCGRGRCILPEP